MQSHGGSTGANLDPPLFWPYITFNIYSLDSLQYIEDRFYLSLEQLVHRLHLHIHGEANSRFCL
jgi:hypothetical protein